jgi:CRISPR-associated protein Cas1
VWARLRRPAREDLQKLKGLAERIPSADDAGVLMGMEGSAARIYFQAFAGMLRPRNEEAEALLTFDFTGRRKRPPVDPVNALLSYAYSLLTKDLTITCWTVGLDPFLGFLHRPRYGRPSLALDVMEEFRPLIADSVVLTAINTGAVRVSDFLWRGPAVALKPEGRKRFLQCYERRMDALVTHPVFGTRISYRRALELQVRLLSRCLLGELPQYVGFRTR